MARFFNTPKPKPFRIEPRYWDPEKEKREARERRIKAEMGLNDDGQTFRPYINKGEFRKGMSNSKWSVNAQRGRSKTRLLILVVLISLLVWFLLK